MKQKIGLATSDKLKIYSMLLSGIFLFFLVLYNSYFQSIFIISSENNKALGWALTGIFVFLVIYSLKKRKLTMFLGKLTFWYSCHFYVGLISIIILLAHSGFTLGSGLLKIITVLLFFVLFNSIFGAIGHFIIPKILARHDVEYTNNLELRQARDQLGERLDELLKGKSELFKNIYNSYLEKFTRSNIGILSSFKSSFIEKHNISNLLVFLAVKENEISKKEKTDYQTLLKCCGNKYKLEQQLFLLGLMNNWLSYHISAVTALFLLVALHILSFYYY